MPQNEGRVPPETEIRDPETGEITGYRAVHVRLFGGYDSKKAGHQPWPAAGGRPHSTRWSIGRPPHVSDIQEWEIV